MTLSLEIFDQQDLLRNAVKYGISLIEQKKYFVFRKTDLGPFFTDRKHLLKKEEEWSFKELLKICLNFNWFSLIMRKPFDLNT